MYRTYIMTSPKQSELKILLSEYLKNISNPNSVLEFEIRFGTQSKNKIKRIDFDNVAQKLFSLGFKTNHKDKHTLKINSEFKDNDGNMRYSNIRTEINDLFHISKYCKTNQLSGQESYIQKFKYRQGNPPKNPIDNQDFQFRISLQEEKIFRPNSTIVQNLKESWKETKKSYRLLNRTTLIHDDFPFKIDLSVVKSSRKDKGQFIMTYSIHESNVFNNYEFYEIEIELNNDIIKSKSYTVDELESKIKKMIKYILSGLQQSNYPIGYNEQTNILQQYYKLIHGVDNPKYNLRPSDFIGPSSNTLHQINMIKNEKTLTPNIMQNYCVTDKADGLRKICFINDVGRVYLIDMSMNVQFTGAITKNNKIFRSMFDGEHILHDKHKKYINLYACFDAYFINGKDIRGEVLIDESKMETKTVMRLLECINAVNDLSLESIMPKHSCPIRMITKKFYVASATNPIYTCCKTLLDQMGIHTDIPGQDSDDDSMEEGEVEEDTEESDSLQSIFEYNTDGLIFTPTLLGVGCINSTSKPLNYKKNWEYSFKWKPPEYNTIDFLISTKKTDTNEDFIGNLFTGGVQTKENLTQYKTLFLKIGFDESKHGYLNPLDTLLNGSNESKELKESSYKPALFYPTNPFDSNAHCCNILLKTDTNGQPQMFSEENEVIEDNMIVEFKYDLKKQGKWKWTPIKVRYDKTAEFRNGFKNYGNVYHAANSNWQSIHNPIEPYMLATNYNVTMDMANSDTYYVKLHGDSKTIGLRDFHNLFVKRTLINIVSKSSDKLIDYAVGKGGDLSKWRHSKLDFVLGIDLSRDNIENKINGACARYLDEQKKFHSIPKAIFLHGNTGLNIESGEAFYNDISKKAMNALVGKGEKDKRSLGNNLFNLYGIAKDKFNISSIQFALHYMFESKRILHTFLKNVSDFTKPHGYFIGTCFNGKSIFDMLRNQKKNDEYSIMLHKTKIWSIKKQYAGSDFPSNEKCVGYQIDIYQETINKYTKEYLVHFDYLTQILADYGFSPLTSEECKQKGLKTSHGSFKDLFDIMTQLKKNTMYKNALKMTPEEKEISFLNSYFIYKKTHNVDTKEVYKMYTDSLVDEPIPFTIGRPRKLKERLKLI